MEYPLSRRKPCKIGSFKGKVRALLGMKRAYVPSLTPVGVHDEEGMPTNVFPGYDHSRQLEAVLLEVEQKKAKALMWVEKKRMGLF